MNPRRYKEMAVRGAETGVILTQELIDEFITSIQAKGYVKGTVEDIAEDNAVIDVGGIGYNVRISADTAARLPGIGEKAKLYTYMNVREDAVQLFGFLSRNDLEIFRKCITVSGIGPKGALAILSVLDADADMLTFDFSFTYEDFEILSRFNEQPAQLGS